MLPATEASLAKAISAMPAKAGKAIERFRVELDKLRETATDLQGEVSSMYGVAERMSGTPRFGDGNVHGVRAIEPRHGEVANKMQKLLTEIHGGIAAGEEALLVVAQRYAAADSRSEEEFKRAGRDALEDQDFDDDEGSKPDGEATKEPVSRLTRPVRGDQRGGRSRTPTAWTSQPKVPNPWGSVSSASSPARASAWT